MYPSSLAAALRARGVDASTALELGLAGQSDRDILAAATVNGYAVLTENVADFARIAGERLVAGEHHHGVLIALSSRFSRRPKGIPKIVAAVTARIDEDLQDRLIYLDPPSQKHRVAPMCSAAATASAVRVETQWVPVSPACDRR